MDHMYFCEYMEPARDFVRTYAGTAYVIKTV